MGYRDLNRLELLLQIDRLNDRIVALNEVLSFIEDLKVKAPLEEQKALYITDLEFLKKELQTRLP
ncbi:MAG: hypothetical protein V4565_07410 [Bacteroidota bacterium]